MNPPDVQSEPSPRPTHEKRDVRVRVVVWLAAGIVALTAVSQAGLWILVQVFQSGARQADPALSPLTDTGQAPPAPNLQSTPLQDYDGLKRSQEELLNSYGWVDRKKGVVRIPVSRAMDLLAKRGLPAPAGPREEEEKKP